MNTEYRYYHFGPFLMNKKVERSLYDALCDDIRDVVMKEQIDYRQDLAGKIEKEYQFNSELTEKYNCALLPYVSQYLNNLVYDWAEAEKDASVEDDLIEIEKNMHLTSMWVNFQQKYEYNPVHHHIGDISFVLYIDVPDVIYQESPQGRGYPNGTIAFTHQLDLAPEVSINSWRARKQLSNILRPLSTTGGLKPTNGDLLMFPSYLCHSVESFYSDVTRVSISGNFAMMPSQ